MAEQVFVGREGTLARLQAYLERSIAGEGQVAFVTGEAGAGKTALIREFAKRGQAANADLVVAIGNCNAQTGLGDPYLPFREVLSLLLGDVDERLAKGAVNEQNANRLRQMLIHSGKILVEVGPDLVNVLVPGSRLIGLFGKAIAEKTGWMEEFEKLVQQKRERTPGSATALEQGRILEEYTNVLKALAVERPLLIVLDDLHWVDEASINLLFHLGRRIEQSRIMIVGTYRPDEVAVGRGEDRHPLEKVIAEFKRYFGDITVNLDQVDVTEGREFVNHYLDTLPNLLGPEFREALYQHTGGHPLFTVELIRTMQERGDLRKDAQGLWVVGPNMDWQTLPARVEGVIEERIGRLEEKPRETLSVASVEGQVFEAQLVAGVQGMPERESIKVLSQDLEKRHRLVRELGELKVGRVRLSRFQFSHVLFQQYLYNGLGSAERRLLHGEVARVLEELYHDDLEEITVALARHYNEAGDDEKAAEYLIKAGDDAAKLYAYAEARMHFHNALDALLQLADNDANHRRRVDTTIQLASVSALAESPERNLARLQEIEPLAQELVSTTGSSADKLRLARVHYWIGRSYYYCGEPREALGYYQRVLGEAQGLNDEQLLAIPMSNLGQVLLSVQGQYLKAAPMLERALPLLEKSGETTEWFRAFDYLAQTRVARGQVQEGLAQIRQVLERAQESHDQAGIGLTQLSLAVCYQWANQPQKMLAAAQAALAAAERSGNLLHSFIAYGAVAWAQGLIGDFSASAENFAQSDKIGEKLGGQLVIADQIAAGKAEVAFRAGRTDEALVLAERAVAMAKAVGSVYSEGIARRAWGEALGALNPPRWEEAVVQFSASAQSFESGGHLLNLAHTQLAWGKLLRAHGDLAGAREHLERAAAQYETSGLTELLEKTRALMP